MKVLKEIEDEDAVFEKAGQFRKLDEEFGIASYAFKISKYIQLIEDPMSVLKDIVKKKKIF